LRRDLLIFDLDGTLVDSKRDLVDSVNATRIWHGLEALPDDVVASYVGNGAPMLIRRAFPGASEDELDRLHRHFLTYYRDHMLDATVPYPGVVEALHVLHSADVPMAVLTNKPVRFSVRMIEGLGLEAYFFRVYGGNSLDAKKPDPIGIRLLIEESGADPARTVMVGDSAVDIRTARAAGVRACGVSWGIQPETFLADPPDFVIDDLGELAKMVVAQSVPR
jgi:phosphoglycolate phosphatase